jgi:hypothetical protein
MTTEVIGWAGDIESDDLYLQGTKIWNIKLYSLDRKRTLLLHPFRTPVETVRQKLMNWINSFPDGHLVVFHNGLGYDFWAIWRHIGIVPRIGKEGKDWLGGKHVQIVDTYVLSMYLNPDAQRHSLEYLASGSEDEKMAFRAKLIEAGVIPADAPKGAEFKQYHPIMDEYVDDDVKALIGVFFKLWDVAQERYTEEKWIHPSFRQMQKDYWLYSAQAFTGVKFDTEKAKALLELIDVEMAKLKAEVEPHLPPRPLKTAEQAFYKIPAKPFKKNLTPSAIMEKWLEKHNAALFCKGQSWYVRAYDFEVPLKPGEILPVKLPMEIDDNTELKDYFIASGWKPHDDFWNIKKGPDGKPERDERGKIIKTTPKIQHQGTICPNLLKIEGEIPSKVVKFLSYRNRQGVVKGWLNNWRIAFDGRISAEISGYAPTSRVKHKTVCNVPKADIKVLLGNEMRELFTVEKGYWYGGTDAAALENRTLASYTYKYDDGKFARMQTEGDPHSFNAFAFFPHIHELFDINNPENKENPQFKPYRNKAKTGAYLLAFGGGAPKLASSLGLSGPEGQAAFDNYWTMNEGLGKLKTAVESYFNTTGKKKYIVAKDGRIVCVRGKNVLLSCLGQGLGAISMSYAACFMDTWLGELYLDSLGRPHYIYKGKRVARVSMVHDEYSWEIEDGIQEEIREMSVEAIRQAGRTLKLALPLEGEGKLSFEGTWKDVH